MPDRTVTPSRKRKRVFVRSVEVERVRQRLVSKSFPRVQMLLIVLLTGGCGLLASFTMLHFGVDSMALRYPLALGAAYLFFLLFIWLWLRTQSSDYGVGDFGDVAGALPSRSGGAPSFRSGAGGDFAGGGASGDFAGAAQAPVGRTSTADSGSSFGLAGDTAGSAADADEFTLPLLAIALALGLALSSLYVVYIAPVLFAEVLVDGALSYALLRHLRGHDPEHWLVSTVRRTALPFVITAVFLAAMGAAMSAYAPGAQSVGQFVKQAQKGHRA